MDKAVAWLALVIAMVACVVAVYAAAKPRPEVKVSAIEQQVYERIVSELWREVAPVYKDFDMEAGGPPKTLTELIQPFLSIESELSAEP